MKEGQIGKSKEKVGILRLLLGMVIQPERTLSYIRDHSKWLWLVPAILAIITFIIKGMVTAPIAAKFAAEQMQKQLANIPPEQLAQMPSMVTKGPSPTFIALTTIGGGLLALAISWLFQAGVLHFVCLPLGSQGHFIQMFSIIAWARLPHFVRDVLQTAYIALTHKLSVHPGLSSLVATGDPLKDSTNLVYALLSRIDLFLFWNLLLLIIGVAVVSGFSRRKAVVISLGYWALTTGLGLIPVLIGSLFASRMPTGG